MLVALRRKLKSRRLYLPLKAKMWLGQAQRRWPRHETMISCPKKWTKTKIRRWMQSSMRSSKSPEAELRSKERKLILKSRRLKKSKHNS
uniref:Uncharacterized protein n=1 Tax=Arundo donax TaxID=35708 RepID=A0A0A9E432_ARUDO